MNGGPSGFNNAPVTKTFVIASALFTVFFGIQGRSFKLGLSYQDIFRKLSIWKLITSVFAFSSTPELMFGLYLLYYFRVFERQIGSNKYSGSPVSNQNGTRASVIPILVFILFSVMASFLFEVMAVAILKDPTSNLLTSGPYGLIFASFVPFFFDIPVSTWFRIFGVRFSNKSFIYLAGLQLLLSSWKRSLLPGICGILAGSLYRLNVFHIRKAKIECDFGFSSGGYVFCINPLMNGPELGSSVGEFSWIIDSIDVEFPEFITSFFLRLSWPSIGNPPTTPARNLAGNAPSYTTRQVEAILLPCFCVPSLIRPNQAPFTISLTIHLLPFSSIKITLINPQIQLRGERTYASAVASSAIEPSEDAVATLVSMGFDQNSARQALVHARNDINAATNILLEAQSH
ncbi:hypothetical protein CXB51_036971 [Gossypium anomalum]|uniref:UBA domain-containing protein n=1 Tax=Gossypium anomalum TaxID=47600 RepID=A0A8J5XYT8_9ROSI|nr:hypothetical protein CXB51_036971 [Gossypium anomalum]